MGYNGGVYSLTKYVLFTMHLQCTSFCMHAITHPHSALGLAHIWETDLGLGHPHGSHQHRQKRLHLGPTCSKTKERRCKAHAHGMLRFRHSVVKK